MAFSTRALLFFLVSFFLFCCGTVGPWASPELGKLNSTDDGIFNGTLTVNQESWIGSLGTLGSLTGTILAGYLVENIGRKMTLLIASLPLIASYIMLGLSKGLYLIYFGRYLAGIPMGTLFVALPIYTGEIARNDHRGIIAGLFGFCVQCSHILTYAAGPYMTVMAFNIMLGIIPIIYIPAFIFLGVESPHYYIKQKKEEEAKATIKKIRNKANDKDVEDEFQYLKLLLNNEENGSVMDIVRNKGARRATFMILGLFTFVNLSGLASLLTYTQQIFEVSGTSIAPELCAIILGIAQLIAGAANPLLIKSFGRKTLLLTSNVLTGIGHSIVAAFFYLHDDGANVESFKYVPLVAVIFSIVACSIGMAAIPMVFLSEIFPNSVKGPAAALCTTCNWTMSFGVAKLFPILADSFGTGTVFFGFSASCFLAIPFTVFYVVETKGKSLKDILDIFNK